MTTCHVTSYKRHKKTPAKWENYRFLCNWLSLATDNFLYCLFQNVLPFAEFNIPIKLIHSHTLMLNLFSTVHQQSLLRDQNIPMVYNNGAGHSSVWNWGILTMANTIGFKMKMLTLCFSEFNCCQYDAINAAFRYYPLARHKIYERF